MKKGMKKNSKNIKYYYYECKVCKKIFLEWWLYLLHYEFDHLL